MWELPAVVLLVLYNKQPSINKCKAVFYDSCLSNKLSCEDRKDAIFLSERLLF